MAAEANNNYAMKWKTPEERQAACKELCKHLSEGYSKNTFPLCDWDTVENYMAKFPEDFPTALIKDAERKGILEWEKIGKAGTVGKIKGFNANSWKFNMQNRAGWKERQDHTTAEKSMAYVVCWKTDDDETE